ncbi:DUF1870 family protein [Streptomyces albidoflavus]|uniref:Aca2/YdiL-like domain-containing protein n=1 Tax=Streptomyces albidoflavus TaxID=1886 RepID=UPI0033ED7227
MPEQQYSDPPDMPEDERMTDAEFKVVREYLGLTGDGIAEYLTVSSRTVRHWEQGKYLIPDGVRLAVERLEAEASRQVAAGVKALMDAPEPVLVLARTEAERPAGNDWPLGWSRAVAARIAQEVPGLSIMYSDQVPSAEES